MPAVTGSTPFDQPQRDSTSDSSMVAPTLNGSRYRQQHASTPPPGAESRYKEKGKHRATHLRNISIESSASTPPTAEHDAQTNSYFLPVPNSTSSTDVTPTTASMKYPLRLPARSPLRPAQALGSPRPKPSEISPPPNEATPNEFSFPIPRQGKDDSESAKARRREAYKSGMSFVSLYELYSDPPPPPIPVPPIPTLDRSRYSAEASSARRARSNSAGGSRERKGSVRGNPSPATTKPLHLRDRSGSTGNSQPKPQNSANRIPAVGDGGGPLDSPNFKGLANSTMSSSVTLVSSSNSNPTEVPQGKSKRQHVLFELLETERIYSSDMALVKAVHLPLALGLKIDFGPMGSTTSARSSAEHPVETGPSRSSGVSTNTASSTPSQSGSSGPPVPYGATNEVPMSLDDAKVIFANLDELAEFAGRFTEFIQLALGAEIDGGEGPDKVGELFLQMLSIMVPIYETYITKHSASIARLTTLTTENPTAAMMNYIEHTKAIASTHSNSWDLSSLLIKPIQRFLKYPLLLETLVTSTPDTHPDKPTLIRAKTAMVDASRLVNEQTQKVEICRTILQRKPLRGLSAVFSSSSANSSQLKVKGSKSVFAVTKSKDVPTATTASPSVTPFDAAFDPIQMENRIVEHAGGGAGGLEDLIKHLQGFETILPAYMRDVVSWVRSVRDTLIRLEKWSAAFEKVIALDEVPGIEALDAFRNVLTERLSPMLDGLETAVRGTLAPTLAKIQDSMKGPTLLLNTAASLRTVHNQLMNTPYTSKSNRPSPQIVEGSKTYLALMQQLRTDLPVYVRHLDKMFGLVVLQVAKWQERWYREVGNAWGDLWKALEVGPGNRKEYRAKRAKEIANKRKPGKKTDAEESEDPRRGAYGCSGDETVALWWDRWEEVNSTISTLGVPSGAALQGVRSLQGLIKTPLSTFIAGVNSPLPAPSPPRNIPFDGHAIEEVMEFAVPDDDYLPPGYFPTMPAGSRGLKRPSLQLQTSSGSTSTHNSHGHSASSPTQVHSINNLLPAVSPGVDKKEKPAVKTKTVSFIKTRGPSSPLVEHDPSSSEVYSTASAANSRDWSMRNRTRSQEPAPRHKKSDPAHLSKSRASYNRVESPGPRLDLDANVNGSRTMPRGSTFRKRLSDTMWSGDSSTSRKKESGGLEIDVEELEAAVATTHAREERELELANIGQRTRAVSSGSVSLQRHVSNGSSSRDALHNRRTSDASEVTASSSRRHTSYTTRRQRPSDDLSEYGHKGLNGKDAILFTCTVVASFQPTRHEYNGLPFLSLEVGDIVNITRDAGRPSQHPELEPVVSDGVDTLFIGTKLPDSSEGAPEVGWLWASFVMPFQT